MNKIQPKSNLPVGIQKAAHSGEGSEEVLNAIFRDLLQTREARQLLKTAVPEFLNIWAGRSWWKKTLSKLTATVMNKQLSRPEDVFENNEIVSLFENERFVKNVGEQLPHIVNTLTGALCAVGQNLEEFSAEDKKKLFEDLLTQTGKGKTGAFLTSFGRVLNDIHKVDPEFLAHTLEPGITQWLESMDFGELKEAVDNSGQGARALVEMINNVIWQYPTKVIGIFSLMPSFLNMAAGATDISMGKLNAMPPDILADIIIALLKEVDGKSVARVVDQLTEIGRKLHTGSALLGEPGSPQLPRAISDKLDEIVSETDATTFWKGRIALAEIKAAIDEGLTDAVSSNPEYARLAMARGPELLNIRMRSRNKKMSLLESMDDESLATTMAQQLSACDVQEAAETVNNFLRIANRLWEQKPGVCSEFISLFVNAVDPYELAEAARRIFSDGREELRPVARSVVPGLVEWVCDVLRPDDDENEDDATRAREALRSLFMAEEV